MCSLILMGVFFFQQRMEALNEKYIFVRFFKIKKSRKKAQVSLANYTVRLGLISCTFFHTKFQFFSDSGQIKDNGIHYSIKWKNHKSHPL